MSRPKHYKARQIGFTLIELVIVIAIVGALLFLGVRSTASIQFWRQQAALRELTETIRFLYHQAMADQSFYRIEFDLTANTYTVGVVRPEPDADERFQQIAQDAGRISLELTAFLNPSVGETHTVIPPPDFPTLGKPRRLPEGVQFERIYTPSGWTNKKDERKVRVHFSPRGFAEFCVIHIRQGVDGEMTLVNNPFNGLIKVQDGFREYEWTYGRNQNT